MDLFLKGGFEGVSVAEIAKAAGAFPNHVTYHFGSKDLLFAEAASRAMLRAAKRVEQASRASNSAEEHTEILISRLLGPESSAVMLFAEAMLMSRRKPNLAPTVRAALQQLNEAGEAAMVVTLMRTGWKTNVSPEIITRSFWPAVFGLALQKAAMGEDFSRGNADAVAVLMINLRRALGAITP